MATIRITDLMLRAIIGTNDWERKVKQDILINITLHYNAADAIESDDLKHAVDYKNLTKRIIEEVEKSQFFLLEKLTASILQMVLDIPQVDEATVKVDKPQALRFAKSVSFELTGKK